MICQEGPAQNAILRLKRHADAADERIAELEAERDELRTAVKEVCEEAAHDLDTMSEATAERVMACFGPSGKMAEGE